MKLELISHKLCPYVHRAAITLREKGVPFERREIDLKNKPDWFTKLSPYGKVPLLWRTATFCSNRRRSASSSTRRTRRRCYRRTRSPARSSGPGPKAPAS